MSPLTMPARTYNQDHVSRRYTAGRRRVSIYWTWSYPWESNRDLTEMDNRFSTMTEVRRVAWPAYETPEWSAAAFLQGIAGTLELFHRSTLAFQKAVGEVTGHPVAVFQRIDQAGYKLPIDERILADTDTLMVFGLDHLVAEQEASPEEIAAIAQWLGREGTCLLLAPHHDVGFVGGLRRAADGVRPPWRRAGPAPAAVRPVHALADEGAGRAGDQPVRSAPGAGRRARRTRSRRSTPISDLDSLGLLDRVTTFNFHPHLPHYALTEGAGDSVRVLARQPVDLERPHPFIAAGNRAFNSLLWLPPRASRAGHILLADSTIFTTLFGGTDSLERFWRNLASMS